VPKTTGLLMRKFYFSLYKKKNGKDVYYFIGRGRRHHGFASKQQYRHDEEKQGDLKK